MSLPRAASIRAGACLIAVTAVTAIATGCGGMATTGTSEQEASQPSQSPSEYVVKSNDSVTKNEEVTEIASGEYPNGHDTDEVSSSGAKPIKPCGLVTRARANRILGGGVHVSERPQGPTCVYSGSGRQITLVVEEVSLKQLREGARKSSPVTIAGRTGWCIRYEMSSAVLDVAGGRVLQVTGPCAAGVRFAAAALPRIPGA